ncbi:MAG: transglycosylase SLT domain-containing protein [Pseudomonadota bacterium]
MTIANAFWIPALAMAATTLTASLEVAPDIPVPAFHLAHPSVLIPAFTHSLPDTTTSQAAAANGQPDDSTPEHAGAGDIWQRLRTGFVFTDQSHNAVRSHLETFRKHAWHFRQILQRGEPYLYYVLDRVEAHGLPAELALLPAIESAFDPFARSPAGASGIWQFMPETAAEYGLRRDWWFDGRRDIVAATEAALTYLSALHRRYNGDWLLALAAYNAGSARVDRLIRLNRDAGKPTDFWHLPLPAETRNYVPKLLAVCALIADPAAHRITLPALADDRFFTVVDTGGPLDLQVAARLSGTTLEELQRLNPALTRSVTPPGGAHRLLVPSASAQRFRERLAQLPDDQRVQSVEYRIRPGDTLSAIAVNSQTTVSHLRRLNQLDSTHIVAGRLLMVPVTVAGGDVSDV